MRKLMLLLASLLLTGCPNGGSSSSRATSSTADASAPAVAVANGKIQLSWTASSGSPSGYYVEQSTDGTHFSMVQNVTGLTALITGATKGQIYYFRVRAYNSGGYSPYTSVVSATP